jgi:hypothetical protein
MAAIFPLFLQYSSTGSLLLFYLLVFSPIHPRLRTATSTMCLLEHVIYATCNHWGRDRISFACPCSPTINGHIRPCTYTDIIGVATLPGLCKSCIHTQGKDQPRNVSRSQLDNATADGRVGDFVLRDNRKREEPQSSTSSCEMRILKDFYEPEEYKYSSTRNASSPPTASITAIKVSIDDVRNKSKTRPWTQKLSSFTGIILRPKPSSISSSASRARSSTTTLMHRVRSIFRSQTVRRDSNDSADSAGRIGEG